MRVYDGFWSEMLRNGDDYRKAHLAALFALMSEEVGFEAKCDEQCKERRNR